jgi:hypothetical protein
MKTLRGVGLSSYDRQADSERPITWGYDGSLAPPRPDLIARGVQEVAVTGTRADQA